MKTAFMKGGLDALYYTGAASALAPVTRGVGVIFMLHHVQPQARKTFDPNGALSITAEFLASAIQRVRARGWEIVTMGEAVRRLDTQQSRKPFAVFTLDDGYRDNLEYALPVFKAHAAPFTVYISSAQPEGVAELWWLGLEEAISRNDAIAIRRDGVESLVASASLQEKHAAWRLLYPWVRNAPEFEQREIVRDLCARHSVSLEELCRKVSMNWDEVRKLASEPLVTIGSHTVNHYALAKLDDEQAGLEMSDGAKAIAEATGAWPEHFAYPYGDRGSARTREFKLAEATGFRTAVTTRKGMLTAMHGDHLLALPRVALNGDFQALRYVDTFLSGAPFFLSNRFRMAQID